VGASTAHGTDTAGGRLQCEFEQRYLEPRIVAQHTDDGLLVDIIRAMSVLGSSLAPEYTRTCPST